MVVYRAASSKATDRVVFCDYLWFLIFHFISFIFVVNNRRYGEIISFDWLQANPETR